MTSTSATPSALNPIQELLQGTARLPAHVYLMAASSFGHPAVFEPDQHHGFIYALGDNNVGSLCRVTFHDNAARALCGLHAAAISIDGYVHSLANATGVSATPPPVLHLTNFTLMKEFRRPHSWSPLPPNVRWAYLPKSHIPGHQTLAFLETYAQHVNDSSDSNTDDGRQDLTLWECAGLSQDQCAEWQAPLAAFVQHDMLDAPYNATRQHFFDSQLDKQSMTLSGNGGRQSAAAQQTRLIQQHRLALQEAWHEASESLPTGAVQERPDGTIFPFLAQPRFVLNVHMLKQWHSLMCHGLDDHAGQLRQKGVKVGHVSFGPHTTLERDLNATCKQLDRLGSQLFTENLVSLMMRHEHYVIKMALFASVTFMSIIDLHPFCDGNGRVARVAANWALRTTGWPFPIHLFASPAQRQEYTAAIVATRRNLSLAYCGGRTGHDAVRPYIVGAHRQVGCFGPLVRLFLDRLTKAVTEFRKVAAEDRVVVPAAPASPVHDAEVAAEAAAAKAFREKAAQEDCMICYEAGPNICTLCCGKPVHINCFAEWLSIPDRQTCMHCRSALPALPERMRRPDADQTTDEANEEEMDTSDTTTSTTDSTIIVEEIHFDTTDSTSDSTTSAVRAPPSRTYCAGRDCHNQPAQNCSNACCGRCCVMYGSYQCDRHSG